MSTHFIPIMIVCTRTYMCTHARVCVVGPEELLPAYLIIQTDENIDIYQMYIFEEKSKNGILLKCEYLFKGLIMFS